MDLPRSGGLYATGNVTYRGVEVGRIDGVKITPDGVAATLSLKSGIDIPSDVKAEVHSVSAVGEQYVALIPRSADSAPLKDGDVIPMADTSVPPDINSLLDSANSGLEAIPDDSLTTVVNESYTAVGGLGPELSRIVKGSTALAIDARQNLDSLTTLIDGAKPVLDTQGDTSGSIEAWAAQVADINHPNSRPRTTLSPISSTTLDRCGTGTTAVRPTRPHPADYSRQSFGHRRHCPDL